MRGSPNHLMQPETVKFLELWFLRIVSTAVGVIGVSYLNGDWIEWASWIAVPLFRNTMLLVATWMLDSGIGCCACNFWKQNCCLDDSPPLWVIHVTLTDWVSSLQFSVLCPSTSSWSSNVSLPSNMRGSFVFKLQPIKTSHFWQGAYGCIGISEVFCFHVSAFNVNGLIKWK